jgi:hypothetical protein
VISAECTQRVALPLDAFDRRPQPSCYLHAGVDRDAVELGLAIYGFSVAMMTFNDELAQFGEFVVYNVHLIVEHLARLG